MSTVYTIDDGNLTIRDVMNLRKAGVSGDMDAI